MIASSVADEFMQFLHRTAPSAQILDTSALQSWLLLWLKTEAVKAAGGSYELYLQAVVHVMDFWALTPEDFAFAQGTSEEGRITAIRDSAGPHGLPSMDGSAWSVRLSVAPCSAGSMASQCTGTHKRVEGTAPARPRPEHWDGDGYIVA